MTQQRRARGTMSQQQRQKARTVVLDQLAHGRTLEEAAQAAGVSRRTIFNWRRDDDEFSLQVADAVEAGTDVFRAELRRRALEGWDEPVFHQGEVVGHVRRHSDTLLIFELKRRDPTYRDNQRIEVTGPGGGPVEIEDRSASLADVARILEAVGALTSIGGGPARPALPAAAALLPAPEDR